MNDHAFANRMKTKYLALLLPVLALTLTSCGGDKKTSSPVVGSTTPPPATTVIPPSTVPSTTVPAPTEGLLYDFCDETIAIGTADFPSTAAPEVIGDLKPVFDATAGSIVTAATVDTAPIYKLAGDTNRPLKFGKSAIVATQFTLTTSKAVTKVIVSFASWNKITASIDLNGVIIPSSAPGVITGAAIIYEDLTFTIESSTTLVFKISERAMMAAIRLI